MFGDHVQEPCQLIAFAPQIGIEQGLVALSTAPQDVVGATEPMGGLECMFHLAGRVREYFGIGIGGRSGCVPRVAEEIRGTPQQSDPGAFHVRRRVVHHRVEAATRLGEGVRLGCDVVVVEAEEGDAELLDEFERRVHLGAGGLHRITVPRQPGAIEGPGTEHIRARPVERMPVADCDAQMVFHPFAGDDAIRVVHPVRKRAAGRAPLERDSPGHLAEELSCHLD